MEGGMATFSDPNTGTSNTSEDTTYEEPFEVEQEYEDEDQYVADDESYEEDVVDEVYDINNKELLNSPFVRGVIIAAWDNTMGPRTLKVWHGLGSENKLDQDVITFVSRFSVTDEISREEEIANNVELKFNVLKDVGIIVLTSVFCAKHNKSKTVFTLSMILARDMLTKYMTLNHIIKDKMITLTVLLQNLCNRAGDTNKAITDFEGQLRDFIQLFDALNRTGLHNFTIEQTLLRQPLTSPRVPNNQTGRTNTIQNTVTKEEHEFLAKGITSHLETHGYSVVIGTNIREVNQWVNTLSLFLLPHERLLCRQAVQSPQHGFVPELFVQGLLLPANNTNKEQWKQLIPINGVLSGRYPITIIDLQQKIVRSFKKYNYFQGLKREFFESDQNMRTSYFVSNMSGLGVDPVQFRRTMSLNAQTTTAPLRRNEDLYKDHFMKSTSIAVSVQKLLETIFGSNDTSSSSQQNRKRNSDPLINTGLPSSLRMAYVSQYMQHLNRRALCLAKYVDQVVTIMNQSSAAGNKRIPVSMMVDDKELRENVLDLKKVNASTSSIESELLIVLAAAEKLLPGVYTTVTGDPQVEADNVIDFFDEI